MFREIRKEKQLLSMEQNISILEKSTSGVLAVLGDEGYPYTVPLSHVYHDSKIYFHCALEGHKIDAIRNHDKVSFCVIDADDVCPEKLTTLFRSVVVFGRARMLEEEQEKRVALRALMEKFSPERKECAEQPLDHVGVIELTIEHMTGKESIEIIKAKTANGI